MTKMDVVEQGEKCLLTTYCDDVSQTILIMKLLVTLFPDGKIPKIIIIWYGQNSGEMQSNVDMFSRTAKDRS